MLLEETNVLNIPSTSNKDFLEAIIRMEAGDTTVKFISEQIDLTKEGTILFASSNNITYTTPIPDQIRSMIDLQVVNNRGDLNDHFGSVNSTMLDAGIYIGCAKINRDRKKLVYKIRPRFVAQILWAIDFMIHRVLPKLFLTKTVYSYIYKKNQIAISKAEILGRLCHCGFEIISHTTIDRVFYFSVIKTQEYKNDKKGSNGVLFKMNRISKDGKIIGVYKVRTMHPYSEYIQNYVVKMNGYNETGKPNHDFRLTSWGRIIRKLHLDEIPQLLNVIKGELNIVGVRPLSKFGFESLPADLQKERIKYKAGCIPPNVSLGLRGFDGVIKAERIYLREMKKNRFLTNFKYFWMAVFHLVQGKNTSA